MNGSGSFRIISESGMMSGASTCRTTCQPRPLMRAITRLNIAMSGAPPSVAFDPAVKHRHVRRAAEMLHEIETHAAHAAGPEPVEILVAEAVVDDVHTAITFGIRRNAVEHRRVVGAVAARLHNDRALDAEMRM